jgi:tRNA pseudouridine38-40 synthase
MASFRFTIEYDGTDFAGSQIQPRQRTVQGELERALSRVCGVPTRTSFAGRTDRGVHAVGQVASARLPTWRHSAEALAKALQVHLPSDLAAVNVAECRESFHPRFDARWREYRYAIAPGSLSPFVQRYAWTPRAAVSPSAVAVAAAGLEGTRDFASFAGGGEGVPWSARAKRPHGTTRTVLRCDCREIAATVGPAGGSATRLLVVRVAADGFLPQMVRGIVAALVEVGQGRRSRDWIDELLAAHDRRAGPMIAPARGLTLHRVGYGDDRLEDWDNASDGSGPSCWGRCDGREKDGS